MKMNRFVAMAAIALLVVGAMGAIASRSFALGSHASVAGVSAQVSVPANACAQDQASGTEVKSATDTDTVDLQCGDQTSADTSAAGIDAASNGAPEAVGAAADTGANVDQQVGGQSGDQTSPDSGVQAPESGN